MAPTQIASASLLVRDAQEEIVARCSLWWRNVPPHPQHKLGLIGHYEAADDRVAAQLLLAACVHLAANGCTLAVGPMDGSTWQPYRFVTESSGAPPFFLEPQQPAAWPAQFVTHGFAPLAEYYSTLTTDLTVRDARVEATAQRLTAQGITIRALRADDYTNELARLYAVAARAFQNNFLFTPITQAEFIAQYAPLQAFVRPELILLAEHEGQSIGFVFALPDVLQPAGDTFIVKTVAVVPEAQYAGLGGWLVARSHEVAAALGFTKAIHALMHEDNRSRRISQHYSQPLRRYTLFAKSL